MKRRTLLAVAGAGAISGCLGPLSPQSSEYGTEPVPYEITNLTVSTEKLYPTHEYHFDVKRRVDDPVGETKSPVEFSKLKSELQEAIRRIVDPTQPVPAGFDDPPAGLIDTIDQHLIGCPMCSVEYVELASFDTDPGADPLADVTAMVVGEQTGIHLTLENPNDDPIEVRSGPGPPFSLLLAVGIDGTDHQFQLWSDIYEKAGSITVEEDYVWRADPATYLDIEGGTDVTRTYELAAELTDEFVPGTYILSQRESAADPVYGAPFPIKYTSPTLPEREVINARVEFDLREQ